MAWIDDEIAKADQQIADMNMAQQRMSDQGMSLGDYDLQTETGRVSTEREAEMAANVVEGNGNGEAAPVLMPSKEDIAKYKEYQEILTTALREEQPDIVPYLDRAMGTASAAERDRIFSEMRQKFDPHLKQFRMAEILGEEQLQEFNDLKQKIMEYESGQWGKTTRAMKEMDRYDPESFGLQSAVHWKSDVRPTLEQAQKNIEYYRKRISDLQKGQNVVDQ